MDSAIDDNYILDHLQNEMKCALLTNSDGQILIIHDQELIDNVAWIELDNVCSDELTLVFDNGKMQGLGINLSKQENINLIHGQEITLALLEDKQIVNTKTVVFINRNNMD